MSEPTELRAGDSWLWTRSPGARTPADGWTLTYFVKNRLHAFSIATTVNGAGEYAVAEAASATAARAPGEYTWAAIATKAAEQYTESLGSFVIRPNFANGGVLDTRSDARRRLEAVEAVLDNVASFEQLEVTIGSSALRKMPRGELIQWRDRLRAQVRNEQYAARVAAGLPEGRDIQIRFARP